jgi:hypothetical protein
MENFEETDSSCLNPVERICEDLHDMVFQHLDKNEILKLTETSPEWNSAISLSAVAMMKVPVIACNSAPSRNALTDSKRHYNNLKVYEVHDYESSASSGGETMKFVEKFSPWLKSLNVQGMYDRNTAAPQNLTLPVLESLEIMSDCNPPIVFPSATKLKMLDYDVFTCCREFVDWMQSQERLEELRLYYIKRLLEFEPEAPTGLKIFALRAPCCDLKTEDAGKFNKFLKPACPTLTSLNIWYLHAENLEMIVNEMPHLKTLDSFEIKGQIESVKLNPNESITTLILASMKFKPNLHNLCRSLVNLETLIIYEIKCMTQFEWIPRNMMKLKKLYASWSYSPFKEEVLKRYEEMKLNEENINKEIEIY